MAKSAKKIAGAPARSLKIGKGKGGKQTSASAETEAPKAAAAEAAEHEVHSEGVVQPVTSAKRTRAAVSAVARATHDVTVPTRPSAGLNKNRSRTVVPNDEFNTLPGLTFTDRMNDVLSAIRTKYGTRPWSRGDLDAGILKAGVRKGVVRPVSGQGTSESDTYQFVGK